MSITARGNRFKVDLTCKGRRWYGTFDSYDEAVFEQNKAKIALRGGNTVNPINKAWTLEEAYNKTWKTYWKGSACESWQGIHRTKVFLEFGKTTPVQDITRAGVSDWIIKLKGQGLANSTINHSLQSLRKVLKYCHQNGKIPITFPIENLSVKGNARRRFLSLTECPELVKACAQDQDLQDAVVVSLFTGIRKGELWRIEFKHINFTGKNLYIPVSKNHEPRLIPCGPEVMEVFKRRGEYLADRVFCDQEIVRKPWTDVRWTLGWHDVVWHTLRHTYASQLVQAGVNIEVVQALMGHNGIATTQRYAKLDTRNLVDATTRLNLLG